MTSPVAMSRLSQHRAFVLAVEFVDPPQRRRINVPGVARNVGDVFNAAIVRGMEAVVHARCEPQRHVAAIAIGLGQRVVAQQLGNS